MGRDIAALLEMVEQCDSGCIISVSSPDVREDASCTNSNQTSNVLSQLIVPTQSDLCRKCTQ